MKLLITSLYFAPYSGVGAARMTSLAAYLASKGHNITVLSYDVKAFGAETFREVPNGLEIIRIDKKETKSEDIKNMKAVLSELLKKEKYEQWIISVGPFEILKIVKQLGEKYNIPYIIDYRDIWLFDYSIPCKSLKFILKSWIYNILNYNVEKKVMRGAKQIVFVTQGNKNIIKKRYKLNENCCKVILNGYEELNIASVKKELKDSLILGAAGKYSYYNEEAAINCLEACKKLNTSIGTRLIHIGLPDIELQEEYGNEIYSCVGPKSYYDTMEILNHEVHVTVIIYKHMVGLGTKVFDYIMLNKPILYVGPKNTELANFLRQFENAYVCETEEEIISVLNLIYKKKALYLTDKPNNMYSRDEQNMLYEKLLVD